MRCDFSSQESIRKLAAEFRAQHPRLELLINNAGMVAPKRVLTADGIESTFATNHLGYFLLTHLLLDLIVASAPARIVNVASIAHRRGTMDFRRSRLRARLLDHGGVRALEAGQRPLSTLELARRLAGKSVAVHVVHPGTVATNIWSKAPGWTRPF